MFETIETTTPMEDYEKLWEIASKPRVKEVIVPKKLLAGLLSDQAELIAKLNDFGVEVT